MKSIFTFILALVSITIFGQKQFQGKAIYMSKTTVDMNNFGRPGGPQMTVKKKRDCSKNEIDVRKDLYFNF